MKNNKIVSCTESQISIYDIATNANKLIDLDFFNKDSNKIESFTDKYVVLRNKYTFYAKIYNLEKKNQKMVLMEIIPLLMI